MEETSNPFDLTPVPGAAQPDPHDTRLAVRVSDDAVDLRWTKIQSSESLAEARITFKGGSVHFFDLEWLVTRQGQKETMRSSGHASSIRSRLKRLRDAFPATDAAISAVVQKGGSASGETGAQFTPVDWPAGVSPWLWIERQIGAMAKEQARLLRIRLSQPPRPDDPEDIRAARTLESTREFWRRGLVAEQEWRLRITLHYLDGYIGLVWSKPPHTEPGAEVQIRCAGPNELSWAWDRNGERKSERTIARRNAVHALLFDMQNRWPVTLDHISACAVRTNAQRVEVAASHWRNRPWSWLEEEILYMAEQMQAHSDEPAELDLPLDPQLSSFLEREARRQQKEQQKREELQARIRENQERQREAQLRRERERHARAVAEAKAKPPVPTPPPKPAAPVPPVAVQIELPKADVQETMLPLPDLRGYFLRERAALLWVSNQSDDLLSLPYCTIQHLDYQIRTALRVVGPLRGRALLSDEVGLGKTIEAGLVLKEYLTRGMVKRFLVLTVPSLVDQWEEELAEKFHLSTVTTNNASIRSDPEKFWRENPAVVASLHTLKQPAHLAVAQTVNWDLLIIDEAHYLRNRTSQAWQAINALPRQFLLLLTATPVQNSLEELYNLVTLLQPGQLPSPKEFRARFIDPKKPSQPREPEELRSLLGQVMIRNTRANAGIQLPPRRAETVLFEPDETERKFWQEWEAEFRQSLGQLSASQSNLWGRLLLQAAGSSPAAWREALTSFPERAQAMAWAERAPLEASWKKKSQLLLPLTHGEGGVVIFTQFLQTQAAIAAELKTAKVATFLINGQTPAAARQPITDEFRQKGGALLLTHSGTEGRNLQFSHRLVNFDLPWNPMEIEQRIGRLHRIGQQHPVRIYNLVQAGTLQEHLLEILQEKLNLFELVVGETGLILGERFSSDEFAEEVLRRWRDSEGRVAEALQSLGDELAAARQGYAEVKQLDETLFSKNYESL
jgi:superfamily II DNA or RNA helicase